jgi:hypothetical protein
MFLEQPRVMMFTLFFFIDRVLICFVSRNGATGKAAMTLLKSELRDYPGPQLPKTSLKLVH